MFRHFRTNKIRQSISFPPRRDLIWLIGAIAFGGVAGPVLLMFGLTYTTASSASLLLNLEGAFTALLAWFLFRENFDRRIAVGMFLIVVGGVVLSVKPSGWLDLSPGSLMIAGACLCWAVDNNLTRKVSANDAVTISCLKGLAASAVNLTAAYYLGITWPTLHSVLSAGVVGFLGYGISLVLFVLALRHLGTARTGAYFSLAPFFGAALAIPLGAEAITVQLAGAALLMGAGVWLHLTERHEHDHLHEPMIHTHEHLHDDHHQHSHALGEKIGEPHSHEHVHEPLKHSHRHYPDIHHRHGHGPIST